tara:strand:- start:114 stop:779 length:666 start_codon:yes stop_codon:yes gene_type:complete
MNKDLQRYCIGIVYNANFTTTRKYYTDEFLNTATFTCSANGVGKTTFQAYQDAKRNANALADEKMKLLYAYLINNKPATICDNSHHSHHYYKETHECPIMEYALFKCNVEVNDCATVHSHHKETPECPIKEYDFLKCNVEVNDGATVHSHHKEKHECPIKEYDLCKVEVNDCANVKKNKKTKNKKKKSLKMCLPLFQAQDHDVHHHIHSTNDILSDNSDCS